MTTRLRSGSSFHIILVRFMWASLYPYHSLLMGLNWSQWENGQRQFPLMLTLLFSNINGGPLAGVLLDTMFLITWMAYVVYCRRLLAVIFAFILHSGWKKTRRSRLVTDAEKEYIKEELQGAGEIAENNCKEHNYFGKALKDPAIWLALIYFVGYCSGDSVSDAIAPKSLSWPPRCGFGLLPFRWVRIVSHKFSVAILQRNAMKNALAVATTLFVGTIGFTATPHSPSKLACFIHPV